MTDGRGNVSYYEYDNRSRLIKATDPNGKITQLQYDGNGNITRVTDAANAITQYAYDPRNRLTSITDPFNVVEQWTWDNKGNLATYKDRRNKTTTFSYDALDRLSGTIYADATSTTFGYSYPAGGLAEMTMTEGTKVITRRFDNRDRLSYEVTPQGRIDYAYDAADRRASMTVQNQTPITYTWDDGDRVTALTQGARNIALAYDQANRRSKITFPGTLEQRMTYSKAWGRPSAISYFSGATPVQLDALTDATFDGDGRPISRTATAAANGIPNAINTLPTAFTASYTNNRLTTFNGAAWTYDTQGNLTGDGTNTYVWDVRNRLMQIKQGATVTASFEYDALNRRTNRTVSGTATEYLHDGLTPVQEKRVGDVTQLITGPGIDDYLSRITKTIGATPTTTTRNYLTDFLGSTTALADDAGAIKTTYGYEPYGESTVSGEPTVNSFQYTGRENDGTGLMYYRARYYHPKAKRFISEDPIGQTGGINNYTYVFGNPVTLRDPSGLFTLYAHEVYENNNYQFKFTFEFESLKDKVQLDRTPSPWSGLRRLQRLVKNNPRGAGHNDIENTKDANFCANEDPNLYRAFRARGYNSGRDTGTYLTETQVRDVLTEDADSLLTPLAWKLYPEWDKIIQDAKDRAPPHPRRLFEHLAK